MNGQHKDLSVVRTQAITTVADRMTHHDNECMFRWIIDWMMLAVDCSHRGRGRTESLSGSEAVASDVNDTVQAVSVANSVLPCNAAAPALMPTLVDKAFPVISPSQSLTRYQLRRANTSRQLMLTIVTRQIRFVGHVIRKGKPECLTLTGKVEGKRARGRQRLTFLGWLERSTGCKPLDLIRMMQRRKENDAVTAVYARTLAWHHDWLLLRTQTDGTVKTSYFASCMISRFLLACWALCLMCFVYLV